MIQSCRNACLNESNKLVKLLKTNGVVSHSRPLSHTSLPVATALPGAWRHYITVKFQLRSSINVRLTESAWYNRFCMDGPQNGVLGAILGVGAKIFRGKVHSSSELCVFRHLFLDLTRRVVAFCIGITINHRRKFGQVWGSPAPLPEVAEKFRCQQAPIWTFNYHREQEVKVI